MTKLTFDVDFNKDPEEILKEIQERAKAEVAKRESKIKYAAFLSKLHQKVNDEIGTDFKSVNDLIRALTQFANPKLKEKVSSPASGRRVTVSMTHELFAEIKKKLSLPNPNKAAIARETGASVVQVRKVASGGYDQKFASAQSIGTASTKTSKSTSTVVANEHKLPPLQQKISSVSSSTIEPPSFGENISNEAPFVIPPLAALNKLPTDGPAPKLDANNLTRNNPSSSVKSDDSFPIDPPSFGDDTDNNLERPAISEKPVEQKKLNFNLKPRKKKSDTLKITRPPMKPPSS